MMAKICLCLTSDHPCPARGDNLQTMRDVRPKSWGSRSKRWLVSLYKCYSKHRPSGFSGPEAPFYLASNTKVASETSTIGVNKLTFIMKLIYNSAEIFSIKKIQKPLNTKIFSIKVFCSFFLTQQHTKH